MNFALYSLTNDKDALSVLNACNIDINLLQTNLNNFISKDLDNLKDNFNGEPKLTNAFQRVLQRAAIHVQSSGRESVTGANMLVALFSEKESHAVYFLRKQSMSRLDAVQYISHGITKIEESDGGEVFNESASDSSQSQKNQKRALDSFCINLNLHNVIAFPI